MSVELGGWPAYGLHQPWLGEMKKAPDAKIDAAVGLAMGASRWL